MEDPKTAEEVYRSWVVAQIMVVVNLPLGIPPIKDLLRRLLENQEYLRQHTGHIGLLSVPWEFVN